MPNQSSVENRARPPVRDGFKRFGTGRSWTYPVLQDSLALLSKPIFKFSNRTIIKGDTAILVKQG